MRRTAVPAAGHAGGRPRSRAGLPRAGRLQVVPALVALAAVALAAVALAAAPVARASAPGAPPLPPSAAEPPATAPDSPPQSPGEPPERDPGASGEEGGGEGPVAVFGDAVEVSLATFVVRVVDLSGEPVTGLGPESFLVTRGDQRVPVVAVDWIAPAGAAATAGAVPAERDPQLPAAGAPAPGGPGEAPAAGASPSGTWIVLFVQADFHALRVRGHLKFLPFVRELLETLPAAERVALVSFDSHLKLWKDFTRDRGAVADAVYQAIRFSNDPEPGEVAAAEGGPGLLSSGWDFAAARDAAWVEEGLRRVAEALEPLPGDKAVVFLGWGMGRWGSSGFRPRHGHYRPAVEALGRAGASVYVLDVSDAGSHTLELGLRQVAADTGGTYQKTVEFPRQALDRLANLLSGHYLLTVDAGAVEAGDLDVQLQGLERRVRLLVRPLRAGRPEAADGGGG